MSVGVDGALQPELLAALPDLGGGFEVIHFRPSVGSTWDLRAPTSPSPTTPTSIAHAHVNVGRHSLSSVQSDTSAEPFQAVKVFIDATGWTEIVLHPSVVLA